MLVLAFRMGVDSLWLFLIRIKSHGWLLLSVRYQNVKDLRLMASGNMLKILDPWMHNLGNEQRSQRLGLSLSTISKYKWHTWNWLAKYFLCFDNKMSNHAASFNDSYPYPNQKIQIFFHTRSTHFLWQPDNIIEL